MSVERQRAILEQQIDEIMLGIREAKEANLKSAVQKKKQQPER